MFEFKESIPSISNLYTCCNTVSKMKFQITGVAVNPEAFEIKTRCYLNGIVTFLTVRQNYNDNLTVACLSNECSTAKSIVEKFITHLETF